MEISFHFQTQVNLRQRNLLRQFIPRLVKKESGSLESLIIVFCSDEYLLKINQQFLHHDEFTDIITFNLNPDSHSPATGEIYISVERVRENARKFLTTVQNELHRVLFHGILHLCGYRDKTTAMKAVMRKKEDQYLRSYKSYVSRETGKV